MSRASFPAHFWFLALGWVSTPAWASPAVLSHPCPVGFERIGKQGSVRAIARNTDAPVTPREYASGGRLLTGPRELASLDYGTNGIYVYLIDRQGNVMIAQSIENPALCRNGGKCITSHRSLLNRLKELTGVPADQEADIVGAGEIWINKDGSVHQVTDKGLTFPFGSPENTVASAARLRDHHGLRVTDRTAIRSFNTPADFTAMAGKHVNTELEANRLVASLDDPDLPRLIALSLRIQRIAAETLPTGIAGEADIMTFLRFALKADMTRHPDINVIDVVKFVDNLQKESPSYAVFGLGGFRNDGTVGPDRLKGVQRIEKGLRATAALLHMYRESLRH